MKVKSQNFVTFYKRRFNLGSPKRKMNNKKTFQLVEACEKRENLAEFQKYYDELLPHICKTTLLTKLQYPYFEKTNS